MTDKSTFPPTQRIGILVFDGFEPIDVFGFAEAFAIARFLGAGYDSPPPYPFETVLIARQIAKGEERQWSLGRAGLGFCPGAGATARPPDGSRRRRHPAAARRDVGSGIGRDAARVAARHGSESAHHGVGLHRRRRSR